MEPLASLINRKLMLPSQKTNYIAVEMHFLSHALRDQVGKIFVDEEWYATQHPDVLQAIKDGTIETISEHYTLFGYYEHRMPYLIAVDETWYLTEYEDIAKAVKAGTFPSGQAHFEIAGYREGRVPYAHFKLRLRDDRA
jgi:hypothetical protein